MFKKLHLIVLILLLSIPATAQNSFKEDSVFIHKIFDTALRDHTQYEWLRYLTKEIGPRLSGSEGAAKAVDYTRNLMEKEGFDRVFLQNVKVPHWVRGKKEKAYILDGKNKITVPVLALGGSIATPKGGIKAEIIEVKSFQELRNMPKEKVKGKIVFFNRPMDPTHMDMFRSYALAAEQRANGAIEAAACGAIGAIVRSMTTALDDIPHTGGMRYASGVPLVPAAAISTKGAEKLSELLNKGKKIEFFLEQHCETLPDADSHNVIGELKGSSKAEQYIVVGGHLDSWDVNEGAHDDGAGCVQSIQALRLLKQLGYQPRHTLRAVMYMNEENGLRGGVVYADSAKSKKEKHVAAIESDRGGFRPMGFGFVGSKEQRKHVMQWAHLFAPYGMYEMGKGGGGADIGPLGESGTVLMGLIPDSHRYFDFHHASNDVFESVNKKELDLGAAAMAAMTYLIDKYGVE
jgi:carboxypeptidase Q